MTEQNTKQHCYLCPNCERGNCQVIHRSNSQYYHCKKHEEYCGWEEKWARKLTYLVLEARKSNKVPIPKLLDDIEGLLASQRHQLKQQVLEAVGKDEDETYSHWIPSEDGKALFKLNVARNELRKEQRKRIEAVFDDEVVK